MILSHSGIAKQRSCVFSFSQEGQVYLVPLPEIPAK
jgi:hypothetical protein